MILISKQKHVNKLMKITVLINEFEIHQHLSPFHHLSESCCDL